MRHLLLPSALLIVLSAACSQVFPWDNSPRCGNGVVENGEDCDGRQFAETQKTNCISYGYNQTPVGCGADCRIDLAPCIAAGKCGDGVFNEGFEECESLFSGQLDCPGPRYNGGQYLCSNYCGIDLSPCRFCGDGIVSPEDGELVDVDYQTCTGAGYFGGVMTTTDCRTASDRYCGDYRLYPVGVNLAVPRLVPVDDTSFVLTGTVQGASAPSCPALNPIYRTDSYSSDTYLVGYQYTGCEGNFLAAIPAAGPVQILDTDLGSFSVQELWATQDAIALLRREWTYGQHDLIFVTPDGQWLHGYPVFNSPDSHPPVGTLVSPDTLGIWSFSGAERSLELTSYSMANQELLGAASGTLPLMAQWNRMDADGVFFADPLGDGDWLLQVDYEPNPVTSFMGKTSTTPTDLTFDAFHPMESTMRAQLHREADPVSRQLTLLWTTYPGDGTSTLHRGVWSFDGVKLGQTDWPMPERHQVEALWPHDDGGWIIVGRALLSSLAETNVSPCAASSPAYGYPHFFIARVGDDGEVTGLSTFYSPAIPLRDSEYLVDNVFSDYVVSNLTPRYFRTPSGGVYAYGVYNRSRFFCSPQEPPTTKDDLPVHAFGLYLVRLVVGP
ncbi:hypothetical protein KJ612_15005 [Myxococcota bacterium]|nr:hypothetical protein [Myxococcota bacterium]